MSEEQKAMLDFIKGYVAQNGYSPTFREIQQGLKLSSLALVNYHLGRLEAAGVLTRSPGKIRGISLVLEVEVIKLMIDVEKVISEFVGEAPTLKTTELEVRERNKEYVTLRIEGQDYIVSRDQLLKVFRFFAEQS